MVYKAEHLFVYMTSILLSRCVKTISEDYSGSEGNVLVWDHPAILAITTHSTACFMYNPHIDYAQFVRSDPFYLS